MCHLEVQVCIKIDLLHVYFSNLHYLKPFLECTVRPHIVILHIFRSIHTAVKWLYTKQGGLLLSAILEIFCLLNVLVHKITGKIRNHKQEI